MKFLQSRVFGKFIQWRDSGSRSFGKRRFFVLDLLVSKHRDSMTTLATVWKG
jgi:hypothetical protein